MSGSPSEAELKQQLQDFIATREAGRLWADGTLIGLLDTQEQGPEGDYLPSGIVGYTSAVRSAASALMSQDPTFMDSWLADMGKFIKSPADPGDTARLMRDIYQWFVDNSNAVTSRQLTTPAPSAGGSNVGSGLMSRQTTDENAENLEAITVELKTATVVRDQTTGARRGEEVWELKGVEPPPDRLGAASGGSGVIQEIVTRHGGSGAGGSLLTNSSFDETHGTTDSDTSKVNGWTISSGATDLEESSTIFVEEPGVTTANSQSLNFQGNAVITQKLSTTGIQLDASTPYFMRLMVRREASCDGTLTIALGSHSTGVDLTTHSNNTWEELLLVIGQNSWPAQFYADELAVTLTLASNTTGNVLVDGLHFGPFDLIDGSYYLIRAGATPWKIDDVFTFTDSGGAPTTGLIQYALYINGLGYLPSGTGSTVTWADS